MNKKVGIIIGAVVIGIVLGVGVFFLKPVVLKDQVIDKEENTQNNEVNPPQTVSAYRLMGNGLDKFDLSFLQIENNKENMVYSPLSIKYALLMLSEGAKGSSKDQIIDILGSYQAHKYANNANMSFANALFIKDSFKDSIKQDYINNLSSFYAAEIIYDPFIKPDRINTWVSDKTFNLINNLLEDVSEEDFILVNALAINMEWVNKIQDEYESFGVGYQHENYATGVWSLSNGGYPSLEFANVDYPVKATEIAAAINKYDIVNILGKENIRTTVEAAYRQWLKDEEETPTEEEIKEYMDEYLEEIDTGYGQIASSTDFYFYTDDNVKVFAKDLKEYAGTTLQYVGIMPTTNSLDSYLTNIKIEEINNIISNLKAVEYDNFKEGVITDIHGYIPLFKFSYSLNLMDDLKTLGITDIFDLTKADLSNLTTSDVAINKAVHKADIEFSNDGIKAAAATALGGEGDDTDGFEYLYDVPIERIDLTFDHPFLYLIRDKKSNEVWFAGTVYEPLEYIPEYEYEYEYEF